MPTCANCHSFSLDGKTMGIDVDGPANDKGLYALVPVSRHMTIRNQDVIEWNKDGQPGLTRVGFMSQVSPDGHYVVSTFAPPSLDVQRTYYITNFKDYHFLQVFFPTRGILLSCRLTASGAQTGNGLCLREARLATHIVPLKSPRSMRMIQTKRNSSTTCTAFPSTMGVAARPSPSLARQTTA
jgi:hypothetical protein